MMLKRIQTAILKAKELKIIPRQVEMGPTAYKSLIKDLEELVSAGGDIKFNTGLNEEGYSAITVDGIVIKVPSGYGASRVELICAFTI
jgi:hypothetical protein